MPNAEELNILFDPRFLSGVDEFNLCNWYKAHDFFEELWYEASGDMREFLQGVIQVAVAEYHFDNQNTRGSILLMAEGLDHLETSQLLDLGYDLDYLRAVVNRRLTCLQLHGQLDDWDRPTLRKTTRKDSFSP